MRFSTLPVAVALVLGAVACTPTTPTPVGAPQAAIAASPGTARAATELVARANDAGGPDNVTVVLVRIG